MSFSLRSASLLVAGLMGLAGVAAAAAASHGSDPRLMAGAAQVGDHGRERGRDDRLVQRREQHAEHDGGEDEVA